MANVSVTAGSSNGLLFLEKEHMAKILFDHDLGEKTELLPRRSDQRLWSFIKQHPIPDRFMNYIRVTGFGGVFDCGYKLIDHSLITALVERWRLETHTFHLPFGEVTVTLQDAEVLWGLQVEGAAVTDKEVKWNFETAHAKCAQLLGYAPMAGDLKGGQIKTSVLHNLLQMGLPEDASELACIQRVICNKLCIGIG